MAAQFKEGDAVKYLGAVLYVIGTRGSDGMVACWDGRDADTITFYLPALLEPWKVDMEADNGR